MCNPDLHFAVGGMVVGCAILGVEGLMIAFGGWVGLRFFNFVVRELRSTWDGK